MPAPMPEKDFLKLVKEHGCAVKMKGSHGSIYRNGVLVSRFAVSHRKGGKREVKPVYVRQFLGGI